MAKIIEAKAIISGEEKISPLLDKLAKKFDAIQKSAKGGAGMDQMAAALSKIQKEMAAIDKYSAGGGAFAKARENFRQATQSVEAAARAMQAGNGNAKELARNYEQAVRAVRTASREFDRQKTAALSAKRGLDELGIAGGRIAQTQQRLAAQIDRASAAMDRQHAKASRLSQLGRSIGSAASTLGMIAGPGVLHATGIATKQGATVQSEIVKMRAAGIPEKDIQEQLGTSADLAAKYPNVNRSEILERYKELRSVLLHPEEAKELIEPTARANSALNATDRSGQLAEGLQFAIKGAEVLGLAQDPKRFTAYLDSFVKAQQVMGKTITPNTIYELATNLKASGASLSDRFKMTTALSMAQEMRGERAGVGIDQFIKQVIGGFQGQQHSAAKEFVALGLANKDDFEQTKTGAIKGFKPGRHVLGYKLAQTDPDLWINQYLLPALEKKGMTDTTDQLGMVRRLFPAARAADAVSKMISQRRSFENHAKLYANAQGLEATELNKTDPFVGLNSLTTSLESFAGVVTSPIMEKAAGAMSGMASGMGSFGAAWQKWQTDNSVQAQILAGGAIAGGALGGSILTYNLLSGLMSGFGLAPAATALTGAAGALTEAAVALGGGGVAGKAAKAAEVAAPAAAATLMSRAMLGLPIIAAGTALAIGGYEMHEQAVANGGRSIGERRGRMSDVYGRAFGDERAALGLPRMLGYDSYDGGAAFDRGAPISNRPITAELHGSAEVNGQTEVTVKVEAGSELLRIVDQAKKASMPLKGMVNANGPGSLGVSSPDAAAPHPSGVGHN